MMPFTLSLDLHHNHNSLRFSDRFDIQLMEINDELSIFMIYPVQNTSLEVVENIPRPGGSRKNLIYSINKQHILNLRKGKTVKLGGDISLTFMDASADGRSMRLGIETPPAVHVSTLTIPYESSPEVLRVHKFPIDQNLFFGSVDPLDSLVDVYFSDELNPKDIELALKYLSAVYIEQGGSGLKVIKGRSMQPSHEEVT